MLNTDKRVRIFNHLTEITKSRLIVINAVVSHRVG